MTNGRPLGKVLCIAGGRAPKFQGRLRRADLGVGQAEKQELRAGSGALASRLQKTVVGSSRRRRERNLSNRSCCTISLRLRIRSSLSVLHSFPLSLSFIRVKARKLNFNFEPRGCRSETNIIIRNNSDTRTVRGVEVGRRFGIGCREVGGFRLWTVEKEVSRSKGVAAAAQKKVRELREEGCVQSNYRVDHDYKRSLYVKQGELAER